jgi:predicted O-methyltransferase YrrM
MKSNALGAIKKVYAAGAQSTGRLLERVGILDEEPPSRDQRLKHWAFSLTRAHDSIGIAELDVPWWTYNAIDEVEAWLTTHRDVRAFEWGSGASTIWLAKRVAEVRSVEHHAGFGRMIQEQLADIPQATLDIVEAEPSEAPAIGSSKEGHGGLDFTRYVHHIDEVAKRVGGTFSLIVVDGRAREACLVAALPHLERDGIIVFDNTMRRRYQRAIKDAPVVEKAYRGLTPTLPYPDQTSILTLR